MAGTIILAFSIPPDPVTGLPMPGALLDLFEVGTLTRVDTWQDFDLTSSEANPVVADATGRIPMFYVGESFVRARLRDANGVVKADVALPVLGPPTDEGGSDPDPEVVPTGMLGMFDTTDPVTGWVRVNGRTIGNASSGALERANADVEALYEWKWTRQDNSKAPVAGGRGISASADFAAGKVMTLFSPEGHALAIADNMGAGARGIIPAGFVTVGTAETIGSKFGAMNRTLIQGNIPIYTLPNTLSASTSVNNGTNVIRNLSEQRNEFSYEPGPQSLTLVQDMSWNSDTVSASPSIGGGVQSGGSGSSFGIAQASFTLGLYQKL